jgi:hypothetical protein
VSGKPGGFTFGISRSAFEKVFIEGNKKDVTTQVPGPNQYNIPEADAKGRTGGPKFTLKPRTLFRGRSKIDI